VVKVINFDDSNNEDAIVLISYEGVAVPVTKTRLAELLKREQLFLRASIGAAATVHDRVPPKAATKRPPKPRQFKKGMLASGPVSHASLSARIKKLYNYSRASRALRPAHQSFLTELLASFDWTIPEHPNTRLDHQLQEICQWSGVSESCRRTIDEFLARYRQVRDDKSRPA
jgi:hypothetical protein